jgi:hypothetical protein
MLGHLMSTARQRKVTAFSAAKLSAVICGNFDEFD